MAFSKRRQVSSFNLAFLDVMFCGFGAVVLLVLLLNSSVLTSREEQYADLTSELNRLELEKSIHKDTLKSLHDGVSKKQNYLDELQNNRATIQTIIQKENDRQQALSRIILSTEKEIVALQGDLKKSAALKSQQIEKAKISKAQGNKVQEFVGEGHRQYLTGLKLGGKRVLILLDTSASMLDKTIVDVIRRKVMTDSSKKSAPKWQRAVKTVNWIIANLPKESSMQLFTFNTQVKRLPDSTPPSWILATDQIRIRESLTSLNKIFPTGGTSLINGFTEIQNLSPKPDNIILITDGLPTQGQMFSRYTTIDGEGRVKLFHKAIKKLPHNIPINTILLPMEGDPMAAMLFWKLAITSKGSFFTPTQDWP